MSELSERSRVPVATIKYYLREGLLPPGTPLAATRAAYDEGHVQRLRLVRALVEVAGLRLDRVREVVASLDDDTASLHETLARTHGALSPAPASPPSDEARGRVASLVRRRGWRVDPDGSHATALAAALDVLAADGSGLQEAQEAAYADAAAAMAQADLAEMPTETHPRAAAYAVIGTLLTEPVMVALRRMAREDLSKRRFGGSG